MGEVLCDQDLLLFLPFLMHPGRVCWAVAIDSFVEQWVMTRVHCPCLDPVF